jgi:hypothetical protein
MREIVERLADGLDARQAPPPVGILGHARTVTAATRRGSGP